MIPSSRKPQTSRETQARNRLGRVRKVFIETRTCHRGGGKGQALWAEATAGAHRGVHRGKTEVWGSERSLECGTGNTRLRTIMYLVVAPICMLSDMHSFSPFIHPLPFKESRI